jgi:hypothetical protein
VVLNPNLCWLPAEHFSVQERAIRIGLAGAARNEQDGLGGSNLKELEIRRAAGGV